MVDTVQLKISGYHIRNQQFFSEVKFSYFTDQEQKRSCKSMNNAYRKHLQRQGKYAPKFWLEDTQYGQRIRYVVLECSLPKLLWDHNLKEVTEQDLPAVVQAIKNFLDSIHITVQSENILQATVTVLAYCKNIDVIQLCTAADAIRLLSDFDYRARSEWSFLRYAPQNGGHRLKFFNLTSALTVYDKMAEISQHPITNEEKVLASIWHNRNKIGYPKHVQEITRFELTLQSKTAVKQALRPFYKSKANDFTLQQAFNPTIAATLLRQQVTEVFNHPFRDIILLSKVDTPLVRSTMQAHHLNRYQRYVLDDAFNGISQHGLEAYREQFLQDYSLRTWFRRQQTIAQLSQLVDLRSLVPKTNQDIMNLILEAFSLPIYTPQPKQLSLLS